jgi:hypothetical protein
VEKEKSASMRMFRTLGAKAQERS